MLDSDPYELVDLTEPLQTIYTPLKQADVTVLLLQYILVRFAPITLFGS